MAIAKNPPSLTALAKATQFASPKNQAFLVLLCLPMLANAQDNFANNA
jgi:lipid IVA palmitoyltransferase